MPEWSFAVSLLIILLVCFSSDVSPSFSQLEIQPIQLLAHTGSHLFSMSKAKRKGRSCSAYDNCTMVATVSLGLGTEFRLLEKDT